MKKIILIFIVGTFISCNNKTEEQSLQIVNSSEIKPLNTKDTIAKKTTRAETSPATVTSIEGITQQYPDMVYVEGGTFVMGNTSPERDENEPPLNRVTLKSFNISKTEITVGQWKVFCYETDKDLLMTNRPNDNPIGRVSFYDAIDYCDWLSEKTGKTYRLPTEAEWEYAARGGNKTKNFDYAGGNDINKVGWYQDNSKEVVQPVGKKNPNELGLFDMTGNVMEWCYYHWHNGNFEDRNDSHYKSSAVHIIRGGGAYSYRNDCLVNRRETAWAGVRAVEVIGFRIVLCEEGNNLHNTNTY